MFVFLGKDLGIPGGSLVLLNVAKSRVAKVKVITLFRVLVTLSLFSTHEPSSMPYGFRQRAR